MLLCLTQIHAGNQNIGSLVFAVQTSFRLREPHTCIIAPGRSFIQWSPKQLITRSRELQIKKCKIMPASIFISSKSS